MELNWYDIALQVSTADAETAELLIGECSPYGIYIEDYSHLEQETREIAHIDLIEESLLRKDREHVIVHLYITEDENPHEAIAFITEKLKKAGIAFTTSFETIRQEDWANRWKQYFHQQYVGEKILICPSWESAQSAQGRAVLYLEPGMAFGTGTHATTCLCMEQMEGYITAQTQLLDVGCGSGILALSAMLLGAKRAVGVDIDEKAVKTARENARRNGLGEPGVSFVQGDLTENISGKYSLIVANIVADVIVLLCEDIARLMQEDTVLIVSGVIEQSEAQVKAAFEKCSLKVLKRAGKEGWLCFVLQRKSC